MVGGFSNSHGWAMSGGMWFWTILFWIVLILIIVYIARVIRTPNTDTTSAPSSQSPRSILDARFARGEINEEVYKRMKEQLEK